MKYIDYKFYDYFQQYFWHFSFYKGLFAYFWRKKVTQKKYALISY